MPWRGRPHDSAPRRARARPEPAPHRVERYAATPFPPRYALGRDRRRLPPGGCRGPARHSVFLREAFLREAFLREAFLREAFPREAFLLDRARRDHDE